MLTTPRRVNSTVFSAFFRNFLLKYLRKFPISFLVNSLPLVGGPRYHEFLSTTNITFPLREKSTGRRRPMAARMMAYHKDSNGGNREANLRFHFTALH